MSDQVKNTVDVVDFKKRVKQMELDKFYLNEKPSRKEIFNHLATRIDESGKFVSIFDGKYHSIGLIHDNNKISQDVSEFDSDIIRYCASEPKLDKFLARKNFPAEVKQYWQTFTQNRLHDSQIKSIAFKNDASYAWCKPDFDTVDYHENILQQAGAWVEILSRMSDPDAFCLFMGSIFVAESDRQQYLWLIGDGGDGKSSILSVLFKVLGDSFSAQDSSTERSRFWTSTLIGKRLIAYDDNNNHSLTLSGLFKTLTGSGRVGIEYKGGGFGNAQLTGKLFICSNKKPQIINTHADKRRIIFISIEQPKGKKLPTAIYEKNLLDEFPFFLAHCLKMYQTKCPQHEAIVAKTDMLDKLADENEEYFDYLAHRMFKFGRHLSCTAREFNQALAQENIKFKSPVWYDVRDYIFRKYDIKKSEGRLNTEFSGVKPNSYKDSQSYPA